MLGVILVALAIPACLFATTFLWGEHPSIPRVGLSTLLGIAAATLSWMLLSKIAQVPDNQSVTVALAIEMIVVSVAIVMKGKNRAMPQRA